MHLEFSSVDLDERYTRQKQDEDQTKEDQADKDQVKEGR